MKRSVALCCIVAVIAMSCACKNLPPRHLNQNDDVELMIYNGVVGGRQNALGYANRYVSIDNRDMIAVCGNETIAMTDAIAISSKSFKDEALVLTIISKKELDAYTGDEYVCRKNIAFGESRESDMTQLIASLVVLGVDYNGLRNVGRRDKMLQGVPFTAMAKEEIAWQANNSTQPVKKRDIWSWGTMFVR